MMNETRRVWIALAAALIMVSVFVLEASALTIGTSSVTFPGVTLNGGDQTVSGSTSAWQADATGEAGGWKVTVASTDFDNGAGKTISVSGFEIRLLDTNIVLVSGDSNKRVAVKLTMASKDDFDLRAETTALSAEDVNVFLPARP